MGKVGNIKTSNNLLYVPIVLSIVAGALMIVGGISIILMFGWYQ